MMIVKIGGGETLNLPAIAEDLAGVTEPVVVVHGANALRDDLASRLGVEVERVTALSGYTSVVTDEKMIELMLMTYAGLRNKQIVAALQAHGVQAIGLTGIDGGLVRARRNRGFRAWRKGRKMMVRDLTGKPEQINHTLLRLLLDQGYLPVLTVPVLDESGQAVNTENDDLVALLQEELKADRIVQLMEAPGLLANPPVAESLLRRLTFPELCDWEERVEGRIKRKLRALKQVMQTPGTIVHIGDGRINRPISHLLQGGGTWIQ